MRGKERISGKGGEPREWGGSAISLFCIEEKKKKKGRERDSRKRESKGGTLAHTQTVSGGSKNEPTRYEASGNGRNSFSLD